VKTRREGKGGEGAEGREGGREGGKGTKRSSDFRGEVCSIALGGIDAPEGTHGRGWVGPDLRTHLSAPFWLHVT
jgi:hypothetical protein